MFLTRNTLPNGIYVTSTDPEQSFHTFLLSETKWN